MATEGCFKDRTPALRYRNGRIAVHIPEYISYSDASFKVCLKRPTGMREIGCLPPGDEPYTSAPAFVTIENMSPLEGFSILIDGSTVYECPRSDALFFDSRGFQMGEPDGHTLMVRRPGTGPHIGNPISVRSSSDTEAVEYEAPAAERRFEISRPSVRFRDGASYLYVARYIGVRGDDFEVTISGDFGRLYLGKMPSKLIDGKQVASGTEFRLSDHGVTVLDWFDVMIDGRRVFSFPQRDFLVFNERGTVTAFPEDKAVVVFLDDVVVESDGDCLKECSLPTGILYRIYEGEGPISFGSRIPDDTAPSVSSDQSSDDTAPSVSSDQSSDDEPEPVAIEMDEVPEAIDPDVEELPEIEPIPEEPDTDPYPEIPPGSFARLTPRMVLRESGILRRICILIPEYRPLDKSPEIVAVHGGERIEIGPLPIGRWTSKETQFGIQAYGINPLDTFSLELEGRTVFSNQGTNVLFFTSEGTLVTTPRGRIIAVHRPELKLGVRGPAKCRIVSTEERDGLVYDEAELGARGTLYNMNVEHRHDFPASLNMVLAVGYPMGMAPTGAPINSE